MKLDKRACRHAANVPLHISQNAGVLYTDRVKYLVTAAVKLLGRFPALGSGYPLWMNPSAEVHRACRPAGRAAGVSPACIVQNGKTY